MAHPDNLSSLTKADLIQSGLKPSTLNQYQKAVKNFIVWLQKRQHILSHSSFDLSSIAAIELDDWLSSYFTELRNAGIQHLQRAINCFFGLRVFFPQFRMALPFSHLCITSWKRSKPPSHKSPIPWMVAVVLARVYAESNFAAEGLALLLMQHTYLRIGNILKLRRKDVHLDLKEFDDEYPEALLVLRTTKTGDNKYVTITRHDLAFLLKRYIEQWKGLKSDDLIFPWSYSRFRKLFHEICHRIGLSKFQFTLHKFRHGAASEDALRGVDFTSIKRRGLWKSDSAAENYISTGVCLTIMSELSPTFRSIAKKLSANLGLCFRTDLPILDK
jgi:integrase